MVTDASPWVVALSSDSDDDRPSNRSAAKHEPAEPDVYIVEDDDVQILNVTQTEEHRNDNAGIRMSSNQWAGSQSNIGGQVVYQFAGAKDPGKQQTVTSLRQMKKNEARQQRRLRAAQFRAQSNSRSSDENLAQGSDRRGQGTQGRGSASANTGLGFIDMERLVTGNTTREWWNNLQSCQGPHFSNLHWNIVNFCRIHELTAEQIQMRRDALEYVKHAVYEIWPAAEVHLFGSTATGLALPWSDIDVAVMSPIHCGTWQKPSTMSWLSALSRNMKRHGQCKMIRQIPFAKVPLLKVVFNSGLSCDIAFDVVNGPRGVPVIRQFMQHFEALRPLCLVLKFFLGQKDLNELYTGGIGSFCLINMVVSHLQNLGVIGAGWDLGTLLLAFFTHFSTMHNYRIDVVCTRPGYCATKHARGWVKANDPELLSCEDPLDPSSDVAKGTYRIHEVKKVFLKARTALLAHWHNEDVLSRLMNTAQPPGTKVEQLKDTPVCTPVTPGGKKKQKQKKRKMRYQGDSTYEEKEDSYKRAKKRQKLNIKSVQQVSDSTRRRPFNAHRPAKLQKKKKQKVTERIFIDFWGNAKVFLGTKLKKTETAGRKGRS